MKNLLSLSLAAACTLAMALQLHSQTASNLTGKSVVQVLQQLKADNQKQIERQEASLKRMDELKEQAGQLRYIAARS